MRSDNARRALLYPLALSAVLALAPAAMAEPRLVNLCVALREREGPAIEAYLERTAGEAARPAIDCAGRRKFRFSSVS